MTAVCYGGFAHADYVDPEAPKLYPICPDLVREMKFDCAKDKNGKVRNPTSCTQEQTYYRSNHCKSRGVSQKSSAAQRTAAPPAQPAAVN